MMHQDGGRALFGNELICRRELHAERFLGREQREELRVVFQVGTRPVAPRVALPAPARDAELAPDPAMQPLGDRLRGLDGEPVRIEALAVFTRGLKRLEAPRGLVAHRDDLERDDVHIAAG